MQFRRNQRFSRTDVEALSGPVTTRPMNTQERTAATAYSRKRYATGSLRRAVFDRDAGQCQYCGEELTWQTAHFDHIVPYPQGRTSYSNLCVICERCNRLKGRAIIPVHLRP